MFWNNCYARPVVGQFGAAAASAVAAASSQPQGDHACAGHSLEGCQPGLPCTVQCSAWLLVRVAKLDARVWCAGPGGSVPGPGPLRDLASARSLLPRRAGARRHETGRTGMPAVTWNPAGLWARPSPGRPPGLNVRRHPPGNLADSPAPDDPSLTGCFSGGL